MNRLYGFQSIPTLKDKNHFIGRICSSILFVLSGLYVFDSFQNRTSTILSTVILFLFLIQLFYQFRVLNILLASLFLLIGLYMPWAVVSEFQEFPAHSPNAFKLLGFGLGISLAILAASLALLYASLKSNEGN